MRLPLPLAASFFILMAVLLPQISAPTVVAQALPPQLAANATTAVNAPSTAAVQARLLAYRGDGGVQCPGIGMCRGVAPMQAEASSALASAKLSSKRALRSSVRELAPRTASIEGSLRYSQGQIFFALSRVTSHPQDPAVYPEDVHHLPISEESVLDAESSRALGFSRVTIQSNRYTPITPGVFPLHARYSMGLAVNAASKPSSVKVQFEVLRAATVRVYVFNAQGEAIATLHDKAYNGAVGHPIEVMWDGKSATGALNSGTYYVELRASLAGGGSVSEMKSITFDGKTLFATR
jgi:hypothetical protein